VITSFGDKRRDEYIVNNYEHCLTDFSRRNIFDIAEGLKPRVVIIVLATLTVNKCFEECNLIHSHETTDHVIKLVVLET